VRPFGRLAAVLLGLAAACTVGTPSKAEPTVRPYSASVVDTSQADGWIQSFEPHSFQAPDGAVVPYRLLKPRAAGRLPLVVMLHGSGAIGADNRSQLGAFTMGWAHPAPAAETPAIVAIPQATSRSANYLTDADGLPASRPGDSFPGLLALIDNLARDPAVDPKRIYLVGFSMGASTALQAALQHPGRFAGVVAFSPVPPPRADARRLAGTPLMLVHGDADTDNPFAADKAFVEALTAAGAEPRFIVHAGMDHRVPPDMLFATDWRRWLFQQRAR
jgi:predicted esterase